MTQELITALETRYSADIAEAKANLQNYLSNSVGVGEHPNIVAECDKLITQITDADGKLAILKSMVEALNESSTSR